MVSRSTTAEDSMPQIVPSAGFTPPCDYSNFADSFDLSLLPEEDLPPPTTFYSTPSPPMPCGVKPKISTTFYPNSPPTLKANDIDLGPDFQELLGSEPTKTNYPTSPISGIYLEVPSIKSTDSLSPYSSHSLLSPNEQYSTFPSPTSDYHSLYPNSPSDTSSYPHSPSSFYAPDNYQQQYVKKEFFPPYVKEENFLSPCSNYTSNRDVVDLLGTAIIKQESTIDFDSILQSFRLNGDKSAETQIVPEKSKGEDHKLLREVLRDTSFQKKYNIKTFDFNLMDNPIKMEEPDDIIDPELSRETIDPVLNLAIEQMRKDVSNTCAALAISPDPSQWNPANVLSWLQWTTNQFGLPTLIPNQWELSGPNLIALSEEDFTRRAPQSGSILYAQLEIWKAAFSEEEFGGKWMPESASSNASSGEISDDEEEEMPTDVEPSKPTTSRGTGSSHIHLWQFLKELLASPQTHGSCIRWIDRNKGIFKIEDSVKVARLWGKRKNRPAMNYDKLSRSIRQYYKKGIMKKTERSQRLVYQFCHPYNL
ncbi:hypothetical protein PPYR_07699 [Photinus pyralis]|uniref:ETS domain-containing protein n=2 Tax=Photinus pyralis TaxID=7054 RepID=A0A1Y1JT39_PHOPY|nr:DNA-binding protein D-ETS-4 isoform X1 [Photinus pyralis]KAB0799819.1 hypothetical protein PPYR_07699 [Photinus pyralis]